MTNEKFKVALKIADTCQDKLESKGFHSCIVATTGEPLPTSFIKIANTNVFDKEEIIKMLVCHIILENENGTEQGTKKALKCLTSIITNIQEIKKNCDKYSFDKEL